MIKWEITSDSINFKNERKKYTNKGLENLDYGPYFKENCADIRNSGIKNVIND